MVYRSFQVTFLFLLMAFSGQAMAVPFLQLGIVGGEYDAVDETIVSAEDNFTLVAYSQGTSNDPFYLSIAVTPGIPEYPLTDIGSFVVDGITYDEHDMTWGVPPIELDGNAHHDGKDLGKHGIYDTYFLELQFSFPTTTKTTSVNTQYDPGFDPIANPGQDLFFKTFELDVSGLFSNYELHFDLYDTLVKQKNNDIDIDNFAPFSHDAATITGSPVPEPGSLALMLLALGGLISKRLIRP